MTRTGVWGRASLLALGGAAGFWLTNLAISLTPLAAEYRSALSIPYLPMLLEAILGGLAIGVCVAYPVVRFFEMGLSPVTASLMLSGVALAIVTLVIEVPAKFLTTINDPWRYFLIGALFNSLRILALGAVIGVLGRKGLSGI